MHYTHCYWCGHPFDRGGIYKGNHQDRHYDSLTCLKTAEAWPRLATLRAFIRYLKAWNAKDGQTTACPSPHMPS